MLNSFPEDLLQSEELFHCEVIVNYHERLILLLSDGTIEWGHSQRVHIRKEKTKIRRSFNNSIKNAGRI